MSDRALREVHSGKTGRGVCQVCYGASEHGARQYCSRFTQAMTDAQRVALERAARDGAVFATRLYINRRGSGERGTTASVIASCVRRGWLTVRPGPDGGVMGVPTAEGRAALERVSA